MARKKNLERAVVLGLLLSTSVYSSAWADVVLIEGENAYPEGLRIQGVTETYSGEGKNITINAHNDSILLGASLGIWSLGTSVADGNGTINVGSLNIDVRNYIGDDLLVQDEISAGILAGPERVDSSWQGNDSHNAIVTLNSDNDVNISALTRNGKSSYGIYSKTKGDVNVSSNNGSITINASKGLSSYKYDVVIHEAYIRDADYANSQAYGLNAENGKITLSADNNISISAFIKDDSDLSWYDDYENYNNALQESDIYAVSNTNGTIDLSTGNENETGGIISLSATANKGNAYGLDSYRGKKNILNGSAIDIKAKSVSGDAFGVKISDGGVNNEFNSSYNRIQGESETGAAYGIKIEDGSTINISGISGAENNQNYISGIVTGESDKLGIGIDSDNSIVNIIDSDYNRIEGTDYGISAKNGSVIDFDGVTYAIAKNGTAISLTNSNMTVNDDEIISGNNGLVIDSSQHNVTGDLIGRAGNIAVNVMGKNSDLTVGGNILVEGGNIGVTVENNTITVNGGDGTGANVIKSNSGNALKAVESIVTLNAGANGANSIVAGETFDKNNGYVYYTGIAINATGDDDNTDSRNGSTVDILGAENNIGGAVNAAGAQTTVNLAGSLDTGGTAVTGANNWISSAAVIKNAGDLESSNDEAMRDLDVVSALYAEDGATINLSGINNIQTYYKNPSDDTTSERVVWAYDKANINIDGYTYISTSKYANSPENKDIAIAAGTATNLNDDSFGDNYPAEADWANVNVTYNNYGEEQSSITGDILAAYAGNVDIKAAENSDAGINVLGDLLSGNGGKLSVDFGNGGTWTGRGDSYIDAGTQQDYESHQYFYSPAFSSDIITGGDIEVTMKNGTWNVTGQSWLNTFNATDTDIYMTDEDNVTNAVTINKMTGSGNTFHMNLDNDKRMDSDMLYIKESGEEGATFDVEVSGVINGLSDVTEENGLRFATVGNGVNLAQITLDGYGVIKGVDGGAFNTNLYVKREAYDVNNAHNDEFNGEGLTADKPGSSTVEDMFGLTEDEEKQPEIMTLAAEIPSENDSTVNSLADNLSIVKATQDGLSDAGKTMLNMSRANYSNAIYMDRLNKRLGEARYINAEDGEGMWVRIRHDRIGKTDAYRSQNTMYELGYDVKQECDNGERRVGMAVDYMHGDTGYSDIAGKGEIDRYGLWLYDTWMGNKGHYVDYVAKWGHLSNDFELYTMSRGEKVTGDYSNNVFSISAEYGRKKDLGGDWYIEPQAQLQLARVSGAEYNTSQHTEVSVDGINSLIGRAGFRLGKDFGEDKRSTVYIKADVLHEFLGDQDIYVRDETTNGHWAGISYENEGTWYDVGFGFATAVGKNSYAFMDFEKSFGHDNDETYQINVGMQWSF